MNVRRPLRVAACSVLLGVAAGTVGAENFTNWPTYALEPMTNNWPTTNDYNSLIETIAWTYGAVAERGDAMRCGYVAPVLSGLRTQRAILECLKAEVVEGLLLDVWEEAHWVRGDLAVNGDFSDYFAAEARPADFPMIEGVVGVAAATNLPINFFEYTPDRCMSGVGPLTNDASVGSGHGWTNMNTAAGGTNLPAGRLTWYTTDYGWPGLRRAVKSLRWTRDWYGGRGKQSCTIYGDTAFWPGTQFSSPSAAYASNSAAWNARTWDNCVGNEVVKFAVWTDFDEGYGASPYSFSSYRSAYTNGNFWATSHPIGTNRAHSAQVYVRLWGGGRTFYDFDGITIGGVRTDNAYHYVEEFEEAATDARVSSKPPKERTNPMTIRWPTAPGIDEVGTSYGMEEVFSCLPLWLFKWDGPNGFQYN